MPSFYDHTSMGGADRQFPSTEWTRIQDPLQREAILSELCTRYWKPLYSYLRSKGFSNEKAKDLVQGFFTEKVLGQELIQQADRAKGKLRNFLLRAASNYASNVLRSEKPREQLDHEIAAPTGTGDPEAEFNRAWADSILQEVVEELEAECVKKGKIKHWRIFRQWLLDPHIESDRQSMDEICSKYGITNASEAYHMVENIKRRFRAIMRSHLRSLTESEDEVDVELNEFISIFSRSSAGS